MTVRLVNAFRLKDSGVLLLEDDLDASASLLLRHYIAGSTKASKRSVVHLNCLPGKRLHLDNIDLEFIHQVPVTLKNLVSNSPASLLDEIDGLNDALAAAHRQHGKPLVVVDSLNVLLGLFELRKTVGFLHQVAIKNGWKVIAVVRMTPSVAGDVIAIERYAESVIRINAPVDRGGDADSVLRSSEETFLVRWTQRSSTGSITSGVDSLTIDVKTASLIRREEVKPVMEPFVEVQETKPKDDVAEKTISSLTFKLSLSDGEKAARSEVDLPYLKAQDKIGDAVANKPGAQIHYTPDIDDDYDEEDPDDDLDF